MKQHDSTIGDLRSSESELLRLRRPQRQRNTGACAWAPPAWTSRPPANPEYPPSGKYAHERLYIRAIVLDNGVTRAALIGADLGGLGEEVWIGRLQADRRGAEAARRRT